MRVAEASESGSLEDWTSAITSSRVATWTDEDCRSVVSAMTEKLISEGVAAKLWKKLEAKKFKKTKKKMGNAMGRMMLAELHKGAIDDDSASDDDTTVSALAPTSKKRQRKNRKRKRNQRHHGPLGRCTTTWIWPRSKPFCARN